MPNVPKREKTIHTMYTGSRTSVIYTHIPSYVVFDWCLGKETAQLVDFEP